VGPVCQRQCHAAPRPDWMLWVAVSECTGRLKSCSDSAVRTAAVHTHARALDRAAARARLTPRATSRPPSAVPTAPRPKHLCPTPRTRSVRSRRRRILAVDAAVYTAAPMSASRPPYLAPSIALTLSHVPVACRRGADVHARRATRGRRLRRRAAPSSTLR
jgi:hypothetical protein